jgi:hypothetical protein
VAFGNETYKLNLKNWNYRHHNFTRNLVGKSFGRCLLNRLSSGSSMRFSIGSFGCVLCWVVWVCAEAISVMRAVAVGFFFNCWSLEFSSDNRIRQVPRCVHYHKQSFRLEAF